jgi:hypothetical protein
LFLQVVIPLICGQRPAWRPSIVNGRHLQNADAVTEGFRMSPGRRIAIVCAGSNHAAQQSGQARPGSADILAALYFGVLRFDPAKPNDPSCDMSKGHCTGAFYLVLAAAGYIPEAELTTYMQPLSWASCVTPPTARRTGPTPISCST